jgi:hypothetical protein
VSSSFFVGEGKPNRSNPLKQATARHHHEPSQYNTPVIGEPLITEAVNQDKEIITENTEINSFC